MNSPLVSVCIPTYNGAEYIIESLDSCYNQSYTNIEVIISDDNSTDQTMDIISEYIKDSNLPVYIFRNKKRGIGRNWNNCIEKANGSLIKMLMQDDILSSDCISEMVSAIRKKEMKLGLIASKREFIIEEGYLHNNLEKFKQTYGDLQKDLTHCRLVEGLIILDKKLFSDPNFLTSPLNKIGEPSFTMFRKEIWSELGGFNESLNQILDYEFYYRLLRRYRIGIIDKALGSFRLHTAQASVHNRRKNDLTEIQFYFKNLKNFYSDLLCDSDKRYLNDKFQNRFSLFNIFRKWISRKSI